MNAFFRIPDRSLTAYCDPQAFERVAPLHLYFGPRLLREPGRVSDELRWPRPLAASDLMIAAKLEHEIDHLHRSLGTSYGLAVHRLHSAQVDAFFRDIAARADEEVVQLPIAPVGSGEHLQAMWDYDRLAELLTCSLARPRAVEPAEALRLSDLLPGVDPVVRDSEDSPAGNYVPPFVGYTLGVSERQAALGGYALMEYLGLSRELGLRRYAGLPSDGAVEFVRVTGYQLAGQVWKRLAGPQGGEDRLALPSDFYLACELALWIPYGPQGGTQRPSGRPLTWHDLHPGWRFLRIVRHLSRRRAFPSSAPLDEAYERWFQEAEAEVCGDLDWPRPAQIAADWAGYLERGLTRGTFDRQFIEDDGERTRGSLKLLRNRLQHPAKAAHGYWSANNDTDLWFSVCTAFDHSSGAENVTGKVLSLGLEDRTFRQSGYEFPPAVSLASAIQLFARKRAEASHGAELKARYQLEGAMVSRDFSTYAKRHYGFSVQFGRDSTAAT